MSNGWTESAAAWITDMGEHGDYGRRCVLDPAMSERLLIMEWRKPMTSPAA